MIIDEKLEKIISEDIKRCEEAQKTAEGSSELFQVLISKYDGIFENFKNEIQITGKMSVGGPFNYRPELNAIKEKLEILLAINETRMKEKDPLYEFKKQYTSDLLLLDRYIKDSEHKEYLEEDILKEYKKIVAKYSNYVPNFSDGLYGYYKENNFFDDVNGDDLNVNLIYIHEKMNIYKNLDFPNLVKENKNNPMLQINNNNQNTMEVNLTFEQLKKNVENITSVNDEEIDEILEKINEIEKICKLNERKTKKWEKIKKILVWIMDKGIDVAIQVIPTVINNLK